LRRLPRPAEQPFRLGDAPLSVRTDLERHQRAMPGLDRATDLHRIRSTTRLAPFPFRKSCAARPWTHGYSSRLPSPARAAPARAAKMNPVTKPE
jgi:hypothetical protein